jgi:hypothetical protein
MANELNIALQTGLTVTAQRFSAGASVGSAITMSEVASSGFYSGNMTGTAGTYQLAFLAGGINVGSGVVIWNGTAEIPTSTLTAPQVRTELSTELGRIDVSISSRSTVTTADIADAVWDEALTDHTTSGTYGARVVRSTNANNELQLNAQNHASANVHQFQTGAIVSGAFDAGVLTAFAVPELQEIHLIHGLKSGSALTVTPTSRAAGAVSQTIGGDGTTNTTVTRI